MRHSGGAHTAQEPCGRNVVKLRVGFFSADSEFMNSRSSGFSGHRAQSGFTLIEIMVVVIIIGLLAAVVLPNVLGVADDARVTKAKADIRGLESQLENYKLDNFYYPTTAQGLEALVSKPAGDPQPKHYRAGGYIKSLPTDPWGNPYQYLSPGAHGDVDIFTYGPDGVAGGDGEDIGNWNLGK